MGFRDRNPGFEGLLDDTMEVNPKNGDNATLLGQGNTTEAKYCRWTFVFRGALADLTSIIPQAQ